jgi:hypothetical protein
MEKSIRNSNQKKSFLTRPGFWVAVVLVLLILGFSLWIFRPIKEIPPWDYLPSTALSFFSIDVNLKNPGISQFVNRAQNEILNTNPGFIKRIAVKLLLPSIIPKRIDSIITLEPDSNKPDYAIVVSMGRIFRLARLFTSYIDRAIFQGKPFDKEVEGGYTFKSLKTSKRELAPNAYFIMDNKVIIGSSLSALKDISKSHTKRTSDYKLNSDLSVLLIQASEESSGYLFVDNNKDKATALIKSVEQEFAYAPFPNIDSVAHILGYINILPDEITGTMLFYSKNAERLDDIGSDVKFIYQVLRRKFRHSNIDMVGEIYTKKDLVKFDFQITNYIEAIFSELTQRLRS